MKMTPGEIAEILEAWLANAILKLYEMEMLTESEKIFIRRMLELLEQLRE